ncbi:unnamed protein product [Caenorhabditis sp. 36 PRJEB53466]|nr:unnamed protein product [Caenorhabditis sp. 36 PRJEB53466]
MLPRVSRTHALYFLICSLFFVIFSINSSYKQQKAVLRPRLRFHDPLAVAKSPEQVKVLIECEKLLESLPVLSAPALLIDEDLLKEIQIGKCSKLDGKRVKIAVESDSNFTTETGHFDVVHYESLPQNDYFLFENDMKRIIPKHFPFRLINNLQIPSDIPTFLEFWRRSKMIECLNLHVPRNETEVYMNATVSTNALASLRNELLQHGMFSSLNGGTLLGWYRECTVIPHTTDMDVAIFAEDYQPGFLKSLFRNESNFKLSRKLGLLNDSFELTVEPREEFPGLYIDIFMMYKGVKDNGEEYDWVGGSSPDGSKFKFPYTPYDPWCSADLHGHIFWVTCSPNERMKAEYGELWYKDAPSDTFVWNSNSVPNGEWTSEQMKTVYKVYDWHGVRTHRLEEEVA